SVAEPEAIATMSAHPSWIVARWASQFGIDIAARICAFDQSIPTTTISLRFPFAEDDWVREGIDLAPGTFLANARRVVSGDVTKTKTYSEGRIGIQDEASQLVAALVGKGSRLVDSGPA